MRPVTILSVVVRSLAGTHDYLALASLLMRLNKL